MACPVHGSTELVRRVPAVYYDGTACRLTPEPPLKRVRLLLIWAVLLTCVSPPIAVAFLRSIANDDSGTAAKIGAASFMLALLVLNLALYWGKVAVRTKRLVRVRHGMRRAMRVWQVGWYCAHCDGVFFGWQDRPNGMPADRLLPVGEFQQLVWGSGGFTCWGKPAARRPFLRLT